MFRPNCCPNLERKNLEEKNLEMQNLEKTKSRTTKNSKRESRKMSSHSFITLSLSYGRSCHWCFFLPPSSVRSVFMGNVFSDFSSIVHCLFDTTASSFVRIICLCHMTFYSFHFTCPRFVTSRTWISLIQMELQQSHFSRAIRKSASPHQWLFINKTNAP